MEQQKIPPQVPPKPRSSRVDENDHIEAELKHIMNGHQQRNNTTPPLPALSPGPGMLGMLLNPGLDSNADSSSPDTRPSRPSRLGKNIFSQLKLKALYYTVVLFSLFFSLLINLI